MAELDSANLSESPEPHVDTIDSDVTVTNVSDDSNFDEASFLAELEAAPDETPETVTEPKDGETVEAKEDVKDDIKADPATESNEAVVKARKILAAATKKERKVTESIAQAETKLLEQFRNKDPKFFDRLGMSFKEWLVAGSGDAPAETPKADDRVTALEEKLAKKELAEQEAATQSLIDNTHAQIKADTKYTRINRTGSQTMVTDLMVEYYTLHGKPLPLSVAANQVEQFLKQASGDPDVPAIKPSASKKAPNSKEPQSTSRPGQTTLTNNDTRSQPPSNDGERYDNEAERDKLIMRELGLL